MIVEKECPYDRGGCSIQAELEEELIGGLREAHALELEVRRVLASMIALTEDPGFRGRLERHRRQAWHHRQRLLECLQSHREAGSARELRVRLDSSSAQRLSRGAEQLRSRARVGLRSTRTRISSYELLQRTAEEAGDSQTAEVARWNRSDERALERTIVKGCFEREPPS